MTDRGLPSADGSSACPFVAFEDDRDERADRPDHRHRCFAETEPAPRALAHQEAYCLSSAFPVCPTFQEWARREAARAIPGAAVAAVTDDDGAGLADVGPADAVAAGAILSAAVDGDADADADLWGQARPEPPLEDPPRRNPPRDWAAPPPWASGPGGGGPRRDGPRPDDAADRQPVPAEGQGLAGSAADRLALGGAVTDEWGQRSSPRPPSPPQDSPAVPADPDLAGLVGRTARPAEEDEAHPVVRPPTRPARRPTVSSTRDGGRTRDRAADRADNDGPLWERQRRNEAYPSIKTRAGLSGIPAIPTVGILFGGVVLAALILFFLPALLGVGGPNGGGGGSSASPSIAVATPSAEPTPIPDPTPQIYVIKAGDTLSRIAREFNVTLDALLEANKDRISNPNRIKVGDEIIIPVPVTEEVPAEASPSPS
jgi:LysM repeat protein